MTKYKAPGVYVEEVSSGARPIAAVGTSMAAMFGIAPNSSAHVGEPILVKGYTEFQRRFAKKEEAASGSTQATAARAFFENGGARLYVVNLGPGVTKIDEKHLAVLDRNDDVNLILAPGFADAASHKTMIDHCETRGDRFAILDTPVDMEPLSRFSRIAGDRDGLHPPDATKGHAAVYTPWIKDKDAITDKVVDQPPSGHIAGAFAMTDRLRGVHKAPANVSLRGTLGVTHSISDTEQELLNPIGINCIRKFQDGIKIWGARTLASSASDYRYVPVRRFATMVEQSIMRGTRWVVFEPNDEPLWRSVRRDVDAFLNIQWRNGALAGAAVSDAYFVKCDAETTTQADIDAGIINILVGFAPVKPAEFVIIRIQQIAGQSRVEEES